MRKMKKQTTVLVTGLIALAIAVFGFNNYLSGGVTGAAVAGGVFGGLSSLLIAAITLIIALTLFAKYFGLIK